jgi:glycosyltransferase involved in cell wall biosynthesis
VILPAHNESIGIIPTIKDIKPQLAKSDRLIVVADNCSDDTAAVAAAAGAEVIARDDPTQIGKGYALGFAINHISPDPPDFVVFIDADCRIQSDMIGRLRQVCGERQRPIQARFLMKSPENSPIDHRFAEFAWILRNWVRPLGLRYLNCPVQLMGTGMIFPWDVIRSAPLASGNLVEDLKLGLDLAAIGKAPLFFPFVIVTSEFPVTDKGADSQRQRWVQGHIGMIVKSVLPLFYKAIVRRNLDLLVLTLDVAVPPLSLLGLLIAAVLGLSCLASLFGLSSAPTLIAATDLLIFGLSVLFAWFKFGREVLPARAFLTIGPLILKKLRLYFQMLLGRTVTEWVRTDRGKPE